MTQDDSGDVAAYVDFTRDEWARLRASTELTLSSAELDALRSRNEPIALDEVETSYLPLCRLLSLRVDASRELLATTETFLGHLHARVPYIIGVAGSVAVGKSTIARVLQAILMRWRLSRGVTASTSPTSVTMPVNIQGRSK